MRGSLWLLKVVVTCFWRFCVVPVSGWYLAICFCWGELVKVSFDGLLLILGFVFKSNSAFKS